VLLFARFTASFIAVWQRDIQVNCPWQKLASIGVCREDVIRLLGFDEIDVEIAVVSLNGLIEF